MEHNKQEVWGNPLVITQYTCSAMPPCSPFFHEKVLAAKKLQLRHMHDIFHLVQQAEIGQIIGGSRVQETPQYGR